MTMRSMLGVLVLAIAATAPVEARREGPRAFPTAEDAARALAHAARTEGMEALLAIFGPAGQELFDSSDPATTKRNRETFLVAFAEEWRVTDLSASRKELIIGHESWPFPVPLVKTSAGWVFDSAAGKQEILDRRIGHNELSALGVCQIYVKAQRAYVRDGRDGTPAGAYARRISSDPGKKNGLYWVAGPGEPLSPLGDLVAQAARDGQPRDPSQPGRTPFFGYYFRILDGQGAGAPGGARSYVVDGQMTGGFALIAWPAQYDGTGIMTFIVNQDGIVFEKDLGPATTGSAAGITRYDPDSTWKRADRSAPDR
jgi:hypothetical protein